MYIDFKDSNEEIEKYLQSYKPDIIEMDKVNCINDQLSTAIRLSSFKIKSPFSSIVFLTNAAFELNNKVDLQQCCDQKTSIRIEELHKSYSFFKHADRHLGQPGFLNKKELGLFIQVTCRLHLVNSQPPTSEIASALLASTLNARTNSDVIANVPEIKNNYSKKKLLELECWWEETFRGEVVYSKLKIIEEHINTSIKLFFEEPFNYISPLALASTAFMMGREMAETNNIADFSRQANKKEHRSFYNELLNYTKHSNRQGEILAPFNKERLIYIIFKSCQYYLLNLLNQSQYSSLSEYTSQISNSPIAQFLVWLLICLPDAPEIGLVDERKRKWLISGKFDDQRTIGTSIFLEKNWDINNPLKDIYFFRDEMGLRIVLFFSKTGPIKLPHKPVIVLTKGAIKVIS